VTLNLAETSVAKSRPSVPYGANFQTNVYRALAAFNKAGLHKHTTLHNACIIQ